MIWLRALVGVEGVAGEDEHRHAVAERVVDRHRGMLQTDRAVHAGEQRLVLDLGVAVRDRDRGFLVRGGELFRRDVVAVVDDGFVQALEARGAGRGEIFEAQALEHIEHEVRARRRLRDRTAVDACRSHPARGGDVVRAGSCAGCVCAATGKRRGRGGCARERRAPDQTAPCKRAIGILAFAISSSRSIVILRTSVSPVRACAAKTRIDARNRSFI